ncbi:MAG: SPOC like C-terminal domain-containing protein [Olpidium bornovanus]|uniref:ATP-dependent DNA helicase II subunit 2 n=1 Tax=Olpidium bornovanus TaxID=278681 RepID=A0A8H7ZVY6_9FUNG|nr:MAG: SPOC like C-terminal domain-containing protein [Olpidium bornovanus]
MFVAVVGREPQTAAEKDVYEGWMGLLEVFDKNSDGLVETKELGGLAADVPTYASAEDVNEGRMLLLELLHKNANNGVIKELADFAADEATLVVVDVGPTMSTLKDRGSKVTRAEKAAEAYRLLLKQKLIAARKNDVIGLVLVGTNGGVAPTPKPPYFQHITEARDLATADLDALKFTFPTGEQHGDVITDAEGPIDTSRAADIAEVFKQEGVELTLMWVVRAESEKFIRKFTDSVNGVFFDVDDALAILNKPHPKRVRPTPLFKGGLTLGDPFEDRERAMVIPVVLYAKTTELRTPTSSKCYITGGSTSELVHGVNRVTSYKKKPTAGDAMSAAGADPGEEANLDEEVDRERMEKAYMYGRTIVPFERDYLMANVLAVMAPKDDEYATRALRAFEQALFVKNCLALVRYVVRDGRPPKLGVLFSRLPERVGLFWAQIPFAEDVRRYTFASLDMVESRNGPVPHPLAPNEGQVETMRNFVRSLDMMGAATDDEGNPAELLKSRDTFNPAYHRLYQCIQHRALFPDDGLPPVPDFYAKIFEPNAELFRKSSAACEALRDAFPTKKMETAKSRKWKAGWKGAAGSATGDDREAAEVDESRKRIRIDAGSEDGTGADLEAGAENSIRTVSTSDPIKDFEAMMRNREIDLTESGEFCNSSPFFFLAAAIEKLLFFWFFRLKPRELTPSAFCL